MRITVVLVLALVVAFAVGVAGGYVFRGLTTPVAAAPRQAASDCPSGSHAVVWYSARTWSCIPNS
jgi:hypothetical protein